MASRVSKIVGRTREQQILQSCLDSQSSELIAVYGRRRVGKTFLIREFFKDSVDHFFMVTGEKDASLATQLFHFRKELEKVFYGGSPLPALRSWREAFRLLGDAIAATQAKYPATPIVIFFDELPWLATRRSGLIQAIDRGWNTQLSTLPRVHLILCGSAASWMLDNLIHAKGGLHNRVTTRIHLQPFKLKDTRKFLASRGIRFNHHQCLEIYMALGGVPHYLQQVKKGHSALQNIARIAFDPSGILHDEFKRLFASLFANSEGHEQIVRAIAKKRIGILRDELIKETSFSSGGAIAKRLRELEEAGFIASLTPIGYKTKYTSYRIIDEYVNFYLSWIERAPRGTDFERREKYWLQKAQTPSYRAWTGYAFEGICLKHETQIAAALGLENIALDVGPWRYVPKKGSKDRGAQIDLLFDRDDGIITLCEMKYWQGKFTTTKSYARHLKNTMQVFEQRTQTQKEVSWALVTTHGLIPNTWSDDLFDNVVTAEALFC